MTAEVTVCIPAYQAEPFIDRTLDCARQQTFRNLRIVVSVDSSEDATAEFCRRHAARDDRIEVIEHAERLGWVGNTNAALDRVDTEFFFVYFHDDIIHPRYVEKLHAALIRRPDAATAHCDLVEFGLWEHLQPAHAYEGTAFERVMEFLLSPEKGTTLRSLTRCGAFRQRPRFPEIPGSNAWSSYPFHLMQLVAGPALAVHEPLYRRWHRPGSLTKLAGWLPEDVQIMLDSQRASAELCLGMIDTVSETPEQRAFGRYCLQVFMLAYTREQEWRLGQGEMIDAQSISEHFQPGKIPGGLGAVDERRARLLGQLESRLFALESQLEGRAGHPVRASLLAAAALALDPANGLARELQVKALEDAGLQTAAIAVANQARDPGQETMPEPLAPQARSRMK
jgi:hypothetical protein